LSGQDGSARTLLSYETESTTLLGGLHFKPAPRWQLGAEIAWNDSKAAIAPFDFVVPAEYLNANQSYDFSLTYLASDVELTSLELRADARYSFAEDRWIGVEYRRAEVDDDAPYLTDLSGAVDWLSLSVGWRFR
jgi:hypothetical protein